MNTVSSDVDISVHANSPCIGDLIKFVSPVFDDNYSSLVERVCNYIDAASKYTKVGLFIFIHLKSYFTEEEYLLFCKHIVYSKRNVLLIESEVGYLNDNEKVVVIDGDLCEIRSER
jgi:CRISPR type II-A-associated protein Csn2